MSEFEFIKSTFYTLKRTFPISIKLINKGNQVLNINSGEVSDEDVEVVIKRAVLFPEKKASLFQGLSNAGQNFNSSVLAVDRYVLVDQRDIPTAFELSKATVVEHGDSYWSIGQITDYQGRLLRLGLRRVSGDVKPSTPEPLNIGPFNNEGEPLI